MATVVVVVVVAPITRLSFAAGISVVVVVVGFSDCKQHTKDTAR